MIWYQVLIEFWGLKDVIYQTIKHGSRLWTIEPAWITFSESNFCFSEAKKINSQNF